MAPAKLQATEKKLKQTQLELKVLKRKKGGSRVPARLAPSIGDHVLFLFVGPARELITVHTNLILEITQAYFRARALEQGLHQLPNEKVETVRLYRTYLYTGNVYTATEDNDAEAMSEGVTSEAEWFRLADLYLFGIEVRGECFVNKVIDAFIDKVEEDPDEQHYPTGIAQEVWVGTKAGDKLRKLIVDLHVWVGNGCGIDEHGQHDDRNGPMDFKHEVAMGVLQNRDKIYDMETKAPWEGDKCKLYHVHVATGVCGMDKIEVVDLTDV